MAVRLAISFACAIAVASPAFAATVDVHAGRLIDPETGRVSTDQRIRIVEGKFSAITPWRASDGPATVDWSGLTVLPGLIDLHTHIADGATESADPAEPFKHSESATILKAVPAARTMLRAGFTTVRDVGVYRGLTDVALRDAINAGDIVGPRMFVAGGYIPHRAAVARSTHWRQTSRSPRLFGSAKCGTLRRHETRRATCSIMARTS